MPAKPDAPARKIAIVGSRGVGKSSLTVRYVEDHFVEAYYPTIKNTFEKTIRYKNKDYATVIVDTAGQDGGIAVGTEALLHGYIIVYDVNSKPSFRMLDDVMNEILYKEGGNWYPMVLVGNKTDLPAKSRAVTTEEGQALATKFKIPYIETSARENKNVAKLFEQLFGEMAKHGDSSGGQKTGESTGDNGGKCTLM